MSFSFKVVLVGDSGVGKTSIINRFVSSEFNPRIETTVGLDIASHIMLVDGNVVRFQLWDTAGQERFQSLNQNFFSGCDGVLLCFDVSKPESLASATGSWLDGCKNAIDPKIPVFLIGCKTDAPHDPQIHKTANTFQVPYFQISSKLNENIDKVFYRLGMNIIKIKKSSNKQPIQ